jgi:uncharacterized tellurite resistance protein B-like protein
MAPLPCLSGGAVAEWVPGHHYACVIEPIRSYFDRRLNLPDHAEGEAARSRLHLAACALMLELAHADDKFSEVEQDHIEIVLRRHFGLEAGTARELMEMAEHARATSPDVYPYAALIRSSYDLGQRTLLAEILWGLVTADGQIARHEAHLLHKIARLLDLEAGYLSQARKDAAAES